MFFKSDLFNVFLFTIFICLKCVCTVNVSPDYPSGKELVKGVGTVSLDSSDVFQVNKKSEILAENPSNKGVKSQPENSGTALNKGSSHLALEGGGVVDLKSTAQPNEGLMEIGDLDDSTNHSKGSKPRKGVQLPGSSVVPRKGVDPHGTFSFNQSAGVTSDPTKESTNTIGENKMSLNKTEPQKIKPEQQPDEKPPPKVTHPKKPVVVTDIEDVDEFEKYSIIQTSTTGEDYIIIGIVIVLGIWCSIFGALIFYRRAGEYWDRRHYRRMDFLVEGMYND